MTHHRFAVRAAAVAGIAVMSAAGLTACGGGDDNKAEGGAEGAANMCEYADAAGEKLSAAGKPEGNDKVSKEGAVDVTLKTSQGDIPLKLDRAKAPCTVHSFEHLASKGYFKDTICHRMTSGGLSVLQCGDPTGTGRGGPGYSFKDELPTGNDAYKRGTLAMANAGPDTNGSQFFMVYKDSALPPNYTVFGTIDEAGLKVLDKVAAGGINGGADGKPKLEVKITDASVG